MILRLAVLLLAGCVLASTLAADEIQLETDSVSKDYESELPRIPPTEPNASLAKFKISEGFRMELAAHEPVVTDPISMAFDERGRLYVVCMNGYSEDADDNLGVIRLLEDKDNDGKFESGSDFVTGLSWPTAIACFDGGVFIAAAPDILYCKDTNGDGVVDEKRVVFTGFARNNVQGMLNSFRWGLDVRLYGASGLNGGKITSPGNDEVINLRGRDFSIDPISMTIRPESGGAQHGATFDRWGERFVCSNSDHMQWIEFEDQYLNRNPLLRGYRARKSIAVEGPAAEVYRASAVEPWRIVRTRLRVKGMVRGPVEGGGRAAGYFTSASGLTAYTGDAFPKNYQEDDYFFVGDVGSNLVHLKTIKTNGLDKTAQRATEPMTELLTSTDNWFRPVQFANAPDGSLYLIDMYREVIEHPLSLPPMIKQHLDLTSGRDRGRIYRIVPANKELRKRTRPGEVDDEELVAMLGHKNGWHRETAARLIVTRCAKTKEATDKFEPLLHAASKTGSPHARIRSIYCLHSIGRLSETTLVKQLDDHHPQVRRHALKVLESTPNVGEAAISQLDQLAQDDDDEVRYQLALTLGSFPADVRRRLLVELAANLSEPLEDDRKLQFAILSSMGDDRVAVMRSLLSQHANVELLGEIARQIGQSEVNIRSAVELASSQSDEIEFQLMASLLDGAGKRGKTLTELLTGQQIREPGALVQGLLTSARRRATNSSLSLKERLFALRRLELGELPDIADTIRELLSATQPTAIQNAAVEVLGSFASVDAANQLIDVTSRLNPVGRRRANELLVARPNWARQLLQSVADGETPPSQIAAMHRDKLLRHRAKDVAKRASELLGGQSDRASVVAKYEPLLTRRGDQARGQKLFGKVCSSCHRLEGFGNNVGPDLAPLRNRGAAYMLTNILDPNREVDARYESYSVITDDGRSISGLLGKDSATTIDLTQADGTVVTVSKDDIDHLQATGRSLMPEGLERDLGEQGIADVIAWLVQTP